MLRVPMGSSFSSRAGRMVNVRIKAVGKHVPKGKPIASLECGKWTGPVPAVIEGEVLERNEELFDKPDLINDYPYTRGWIAKLKPTNLERDLKACSWKRFEEASLMAPKGRS